MSLQANFLAPMPQNQASRPQKEASQNQLDNEALDLVFNEEKRYKSKGYGFIVAILIVASVIAFIPALGKAYWQSILNLGNIHVTYFVAANLIHVMMLIFATFAYGILYKMKIPFFDRYRIESSPWPWEENPQHFKKLMKKTYKALFLNYCILFPVMIFFQAYIGLPHRIDFESFPSRTQFAFQLVFCMFCQDFVFYWSHRTMHRPQIYGMIHKQHHEFTQPIGLATQYAHPVEFLLGNVLPLITGPLILGKRMHLFTRIFWFFLDLAQSIDSHSGYQFSWSPYTLVPFSGSAQYHNYHHTHNIGNYGHFFSIWDSVFGTNKHYLRHYYKVDKLRDQLNEQERISKAKEKQPKEKMN